jgi:hypothetical protein
MRHTTTTTATAVLLLALTACGISSSDDGKPVAASHSPSPSVDPVVPFMRSVEDAHLNSYADGTPAWQDLGAFWEPSSGWATMRRPRWVRSRAAAG